MGFEMNIGTWIDIILFVVFAIAVIVGIVNGFVSMLMRLLAFVGAGAAGWLLSIPIAKWVYGSFLSGKLNEILNEKLTAFAQDGGTISLPFGLQNRLPGELGDMLKYSDVPTVAKHLTDNVLADPVMNIVRILAFILIFAIVLAILLWIARVTKGVNKAPVFGTFNKVLGGVFGGVIGFVLCYVAATLVDFFVKLFSNGISAETMGHIGSATVYNWLLKLDLLGLIS